jgi:hypothetical protein
MPGDHVEAAAPARGDEAGVYAYSELHARRKIKPGAPSKSVELKARVYGARRVVLVQLGHAENGHHGVANVLLHVAAVLAHYGLEAGEHPGHQGVHLLRVAPLRKRGEALHVGEEHGNAAALAFFEEFRPDRGSFAASSGSRASSMRTWYARFCPLSICSSSKLVVPGKTAHPIA